MQRIGAASIGRDRTEGEIDQVSVCLGGEAALTKSVSGTSAKAAAAVAGIATLKQNKRRAR